MPSISEIRRVLAAHKPVALAVDGKHQAAVAVVLRNAKGAPELLLIERGLHAEYMLVDEPAPLVEGLLAFFQSRL